MAQIPLVPTRIVHTRATYGDGLSPILSRQAEASENTIETLEATQTNVSCVKTAIWSYLLRCGLVVAPVLTAALPIWYPCVLASTFEMK